jgi:hemolysin D
MTSLNPAPAPITSAETPPPPTTTTAVRSVRRPPDRKGHELEFLPAALEAIETPASSTARITALLIASFALFAVVWAVVGHIDIIAVTRGRIIQQDRNKLVQPLEPGIVRSIHVVEGRRVDKGALLVELDPTDSAADADRVEWELRVAETEAARLRAALAGERDFQPPPGAASAQVALQRSILITQLAARDAGLAAIDSQERQRRAEKTALAAEKARLAATLPLIREQVQAKRALSRQGFSPRFDLLELEKELAEVEYGGIAAAGREEEADAALRGLADERRRIVAEFDGKAMSDLAAAENHAAAARQELTKAHRRQERQVLTAPAAGVVQQLSVHTVGGVVTTAETLMVIVPEQRTLLVETQVDNKDIGFIRIGMPVEVKVDAFPFTRYGLLPGAVTGVSHDVILPPDGVAARTAGSDPASGADSENGPKFAARIGLERAVFRGEDGEDIALAPGMAVTAEIKTGRRRIIDYLLSPVLAHVHDAMRER